MKRSGQLGHWEPVLIEGLVCCDWWWWCAWGRQSQMIWNLWRMQLSQILAILMLCWGRNNFATPPHTLHLTLHLYRPIRTHRIHFPMSRLRVIWMTFFGPHTPSRWNSLTTNLTPLHPTPIWRTSMQSQPLTTLLVTTQTTTCTGQIGWWLYHYATSNLSSDIPAQPIRITNTPINLNMRPQPTFDSNIHHLSICPAILSNPLINQHFTHQTDATWSYTAFDNPRQITGLEIVHLSL